MLLTSVTGCLLVYSKGGVDVFEAARFGSSVPVHRAPAERANSQAKQEFTALRHNSEDPIFVVLSPHVYQIAFVSKCSFVDVFLTLFSIDILL